MTDFDSDYTAIRGEMVNLTAALTLLNKLKGGVNTYGANTTVNYVTALFAGTTEMQENIPVMAIGNSDYILIEMTLPEHEHWFENHNLLLYTPYFYQSQKDGVDYTVFGSVDQTLFFDRSTVYPGSKINICITASKDAAQHFEALGYYISKIPANYNQVENASTFNFLIRFGSLEAKVDDTLLFRDNIKMTYYQYTATQEQSTFNAKYIRATAQVPGLPSKDKQSEWVVNRFTAVEQYLDSILSDKNTLYPYMSNQTTPPVKYAVQSFYESINLPVPINIQANNTKENYFMSDSIAIDTDSSEPLYLHVLYLNQNAAGAALTSNIQVYDGKSGSHQLLNLDDGNTAFIATAPDLPAFSQVNYPYVDDDELDSYPNFGISSISIDEILRNNSDIDSLFVVERFSYNPNNFNHTAYPLCNASVAYVGPALTDEQTDYLTRHFPKIAIGD